MTRNPVDGAAKSGASDSQNRPEAAGATDPDLTRIALAWPRLRDDVKAAILAMIETAED
jgi:hypothetical protein